MENDEIQDLELEQQNENVEEESSEQDSTNWQTEAEQAKAEAAKWKAIAERNKKRSQTKLQEQPDDDIKKTVEELKLAETKRRFGYENGLSPEETDIIFSFNPNATKETLEHPLVKGGLEAIRSKQKIESNTPRTSFKAGSILPSSKKPLTQSEKQAAFEKARDSFLKK